MWSSSAGAGGQRGFTLLEILIALAIVSVALAAVMRTTGMLTTNNGVLRDRALALMSAQNRLVELQLAPPVATVSRDRAPCPQGGLALVCETRLTDVVRDPAWRPWKCSATGRRAPAGHAQRGAGQSEIGPWTGAGRAVSR